MKKDSKIIKSKKLNTTKNSTISVQDGSKKISFRVLSSSELKASRNPAYQYLVK